MSSIILMVLERTFREVSSTTRMKVRDPLVALIESNATFNLYLHSSLREFIFVLKYQIFYTIKLCISFSGVCADELLCHFVHGAGGICCCEVPCVKKYCKGEFSWRFCQSYKGSIDLELWKIFIPKILRIWIVNLIDPLHGARVGNNQIILTLIDPNWDLRIEQLFHTGNLILHIIISQFFHHRRWEKRERSWGFKAKLLEFGGVLIKLIDDNYLSLDEYILWGDPW